MENLASQILRQVFRIHKFEKIKHLSSAMLEDSLELLEKVSSAKNRLIVVFDEFQEVDSIDKTLAKQLRAIMQRQKGLNYIFMGSQESMMEEICPPRRRPPLPKKF